MNQVSSLATGGATVTAASLVPAVTWVLHGCATPMPDSVPFLVAGLIMTVAHALYNKHGVAAPNA